MSADLHVPVLRRDQIPQASLQGTKPVTHDSFEANTAVDDFIPRRAYWERAQKADPSGYSDNSDDIRRAMSDQTSGMMSMDYGGVTSRRTSLQPSPLDGELSVARRGPINPNSLHIKSHTRNIIDEGVDGLQSPTKPSRDERPPSRARTTSIPSIRFPSTNQCLVRNSMVRSRPASSTSSYGPASSFAMPALQSSDAEGLEPLDEENVEPGSFDLVNPADEHASPKFSLETRSELLFSRDHLTAIFSDPAHTSSFTSFLCDHRPGSIPLLIYYFNALKALKAIDYSNALQESLVSLQNHEFTSIASELTVNEPLREKAEMAFEALVREELPRYITHKWIFTVSASIKHRIAGTMPQHLITMSEGLAEVFCLTDPSREDNPIIFVSEEFQKTTQYGQHYVIGRNCRFLQGPKTNPFSVKRIREQLAAGKEHYETFLNYRRDGSPFMNLLMCAPLLDSKGQIRYYIGAQVDVSGLAKDCTGLPALQKLVDEGNGMERDDRDYAESRFNGHSSDRDEFRELAAMFNMPELETVRQHGGTMHRPPAPESLQGEPAQPSTNWPRRRVIIQDETAIAATLMQHQQSQHERQQFPSNPMPSPAASSGRLIGVYEHYLLVRPYPSLRILFASPSLRIPGTLQTPFLSKIGGSPRVRDELAQAFADGTGITARVQWLVGRHTNGGDGGTGGGGRPRWIHCTPLLAAGGVVGVWMVVVVHDETDGSYAFRKVAPPIEAHGQRSQIEREKMRMRGGAGVDPMGVASFTTTDPDGIVSEDGILRLPGEGEAGEVGEASSFGTVMSSLSTPRSELAGLRLSG